MSLPYGLAVRIPGFHPGGPGSTPGMGTSNFILQGKVFPPIKRTRLDFTFLGGETLLWLYYIKMTILFVMICDLFISELPCQRNYSIAFSTHLGISR